MHFTMVGKCNTRTELILNTILFSKIYSMAFSPILIFYSPPLPPPLIVTPSCVNLDFFQSRTFVTSYSRPESKQYSHTQDAGYAHRLLISPCIARRLPVSTAFSKSPGLYIFLLALKTSSSRNKWISRCYFIGFLTSLSTFVRFNQKIFRFIFVIYW